MHYLHLFIHITNIAGSIQSSRFFCSSTNYCASVLCDTQQKRIDSIRWYSLEFVVDHTIQTHWLINSIDRRGKVRSIIDFTQIEYIDNEQIKTVTIALMYRALLKSIPAATTTTTTTLIFVRVVSKCFHISVTVWAIPILTHWHNNSVLTSNGEESATFTRITMNLNTHTHTHKKNRQIMDLTPQKWIVWRAIVHLYCCYWFWFHLNDISIMKWTNRSFFAVQCECHLDEWFAGVGFIGSLKMNMLFYENIQVK